MLKRLLRLSVPRARTHERTRGRRKKDEKKRIVFRPIAVMLTTRDGILMDRGRGSLRRNCPAGGPDRQIYIRPARKVNFMFQRTLPSAGVSKVVLDVPIESHRRAFSTVCRGPFTKALNRTR